MHAAEYQKSFFWSSKMLTKFLIHSSGMVTFLIPKTDVEGTVGDCEEDFKELKMEGEKSAT